MNLAVSEHLTGCSPHQKQVKKHRFLRSERYPRMLYKQVTKKPKRTRNCSKHYSELSLIRRVMKTTKKRE